MNYFNVELVIFMLVVCAQQALLEHKGKTFIFGFMQNNSTLTPEIYVISQEKNAFITIRVPLDETFEDITTTIPHDQVTCITLPVSVRMQSGKIGNSGIEIISNTNIIVYGKNLVNGSSEVYLIEPVTDIGDHYIATSHKSIQEFSANTIGIIATHPDTEVTIKVPKSGRNMTLIFGRYTCLEGQQLTLGLNAYQTVQLESFQDLTGVKITSTYPITVLSGQTSQSSLKNESVLIDHSEGQLLPTKNWGRAFIAVPHGTEDIFHIIAKENSTAVNVRKKINQAITYQLDESQYTKVNVTKEDYISIEANKPVLVLQYLVTQIMQGDCGVECGSAVVLMVPPLEKRRKHQYLFSTVNAASGKQNVNLVIATPLRDGMLLNGMDLLSSINSSTSNSSSHPKWSIIDSNSNINYSSIQFSVDAGSLHELTHNSSSSSNASFVVTSYGYPNNEKQLANLKTASNLTVPIQTPIEDVPYTLSGNGAIPTAKVEKSKSNNEINNAYLAKSNTFLVEERVSTPVMAVIVSLCSAILFVIVCIVGFIFAEFAFHNGEQSLFQNARVAPFEHTDN